MSMTYSLVGLGKLEQFRMALLEANPLASALEKTEIAAAALPPFVVRRQTQAAAFQQALDIADRKAAFLEWEDGVNIRLGGDIPAARFVGTDAHIAPNRVVADKGLERFDLELTGTPAHPRRGQHAAVHI